ncbi:MAG: hypothetical protein ABMB14_11685 [Myxococcota bacterium]
MGVWLVAVLGMSRAWGCPDYNADPTQLQLLEPAATKGALTAEEKDCLEDRYAAAKVQTVKDKISRVELVNAYAYSTKSWAQLVRRHLEEVDRSDPDIAYLYAFYLFNTDRKNAAEVVKWTEVALERKDVWSGDVFVGRVYGLYKLRALAANVLWADAEDRRTHGEGNVNNGAIEGMRNDVKVYAREWLDFAKVAGRDTAESAALCLSAATRAIACGLDEQVKDPAKEPRARDAPKP